MITRLADRAAELRHRADTFDLEAYRQPLGVRDAFRRRVRRLHELADAIERPMASTLVRIVSAMAGIAERKGEHALATACRFEAARLRRLARRSPASPPGAPHS